MADKPAEPTSTKEPTPTPTPTLTPTPTPAPAPAQSAAVTSDVPMADGGEKPEPGVQKTDMRGSDETDKKKDEGEVEPATGAKTEDVEMKDAHDAPAPSASEAADAPADRDTAAKDEMAPGQESKKTPAKSIKDRRKSTGGSAAKSKTLSRKASKASLSNVDAQPGDLFLVKLKGFPAWPVIVADESMLPLILIQSRPVSAARSDGSYAEPFADGGKRVAERKLPVMYLHTNEFGWVLNTVLQPLGAEKAAESVNQSMKNKDLKQAFELAAEAHDLAYYKEVLQKHQEELAEAQRAEEERVAKAEAKAKAKAVREAVKAAAAVSLADKDGDLDMPDDQPEDESEGTERSSTTKAAKSKKRKAEEDVAPPQKAESVKKPKIKLTTSSAPKTSNGVTLKSNKEATDAKTKIKKSSKDDKESSAKTNPLVMSDEKKKREILFLRHRLQRGLLMKDKEPQPEEMKAMSEHLAKLEGYPDLEAWVIKETKINKVLKAILKIDEIPRESEFNFKSRSNALLEKWNKVLAADLAAGPAALNGLNGADDGDKSALPEKEEEGEEERANGQEKALDDAKGEDKSDKSDLRDVEMTDTTKDVEKEEPADEPTDKTVIESVETAA